MQQWNKRDDFLLFHGNSMEILANLKEKVDMIFADPPYFYGAQNEAYKGEVERKMTEAVCLQRVAMVASVRSAQNEMFT